MRIGPTRWFLAAATLAGKARAQDTSNKVVVFKASDFSIYTYELSPEGIAPTLLAGIIDLDLLSQQQRDAQFGWDSNQTVQAVNLYISHDNRPQKIGSTSPSGFHPQLKVLRDIAAPSFGDRRLSENLVDMNFDGPQMVKLSKGAISALDSNLKSLMYLEAIWGNGQWKSYSRAFTFVRSPDGATMEGLKHNFSNPNAIMPETAPSQILATGVVDTSVSPPTSAPTEAATPSVTPAEEASSGGGLSVGAIAGIAVGCGVVGIALIAVLVWFFCFRRRRHDGMTGYGAARNQTGELISEKEANSGLDHVPHSPYSDDGNMGTSHRGMHHGNDHFMASSAAGSALAATDRDAPVPNAPLADHERSYTPYSDGHHQRLGSVGSPASQRASLVASQVEPTHPIDHNADPHAAPNDRSTTATSQYRHLVEEGMTVDEIRRLEDEERQLDAAIEQAGQRR